MSFQLNKPKSFPRANYLTWGVFIGIIILKIFFALQVASAGATLSYLESEEQKLFKENFTLNDELASTESLVKYEAMAKDLGFNDKATIEYIQLEDTFAKVQ